MELEVGPFDPALHVRSRDHYEAVRREAQLLDLLPDTPPHRYEDLLDRLRRQFPPDPVDPIVDRAYLAGEPAFTARVEIADELVPDALDACDQLERLLDDLDSWAMDSDLAILEASPEVKAYRTAYLAQVRDQLRRALPAAS
ncbi:MAG TPA: hypothetical protein VG276_26005 [Actinomycetes bacterium]|jgi:hypothetical protein|nr:hypothetical protein [Actinomycetes bacterium]